MVDRRHIGRWIHKPGQKVVKLYSLNMDKGEAMIQEGQRIGSDIQIQRVRTIQGHSEIRRFFMGHLGVLPATWLPTERGVKLLEQREARAWLRDRSIELRWCTRILGIAAVTAVATEDSQASPGGARARR